MTVETNPFAEKNHLSTDPEENRKGPVKAKQQTRSSIRLYKDKIIMGENYHIFYKPESLFLSRKMVVSIFFPNFVFLLIVKNTIILNRIIPNISVDCVIFGFDSKDLNVLLVERTLSDPVHQSVVFSDYTLAGNHILEGENPDHAANRILNDLTGLHDIYLEQFHTFGDTDRLSQEKDRLWTQSLGSHIADHVITIGYYSLIDSISVILSEHNARKVRWFPVNNLPVLGFDHGLIIQKALECLRRKLKEEPIGFELLPEKFTLTQVQHLYEAILGTKLDTRNFRKKLQQMKYIIPLDEKQKAVRHKPAQLYIYSRDVYERTRKEGYGYLI
jgi:8-oxo-dGTP diphosphatase